MNWHYHIIPVVISHVGCGWSVIMMCVVMHHQCHCYVVVGTCCVKWWWWMGFIADGGDVEEAMWQWLSHSCHIWDAMCCDWDIFSFVSHIKRPLWLSWLE